MLIVMNALWTLISGKRLALDDPELLELVDLIDHHAVWYGKQKAFNGFPWLRFIAPKASGWTDMKYDMDTLLAFIDKTIKPYIGVYNPEGTY